MILVFTVTISLPQYSILSYPFQACSSISLTMSEFLQFSLYPDHSHGPLQAFANRFSSVTKVHTASSKRSIFRRRLSGSRLVRHYMPRLRLTTITAVGASPPCLHVRRFCFLWPSSSLDCSGLYTLGTLYCRPISSQTCALSHIGIHRMFHSSSR